MANELDFGDGTWDEAGGTVRGKLNEFNGVLNGNGQDGLVKTVAGYRAQLRLIVLLLSITLGVLAIMATLFGIWISHIDSIQKTGSNWPQMGKTTTQDAKGWPAN